MSKIGVTRLLASWLIVLLCTPCVFPVGIEKIVLTPEKGKITLVAVMTKAGSSGSVKMNVTISTENGRIRLSGERGRIVGYIGENGLFNLARGTQEIDLLDQNNRLLGSIASSGNINSIIADSGRAVINDCGRIALIGENGRQVGYIGENGRVMFPKIK